MTVLLNIGLLGPTVTCRDLGRELAIDLFDARSLVEYNMYGAPFIYTVLSSHHCECVKAR